MQPSEPIRASSSAKKTKKSTIKAANGGVSEYIPLLSDGKILNRAIGGSEIRMREDDHIDVASAKGPYSGSLSMILEDQTAKFKAGLKVYRDSSSLILLGQNSKWS